jgi:hypothetical protein
MELLLVVDVRLQLRRGAVIHLVRGAEQAVHLWGHSPGSLTFMHTGNVGS